MYTELCVQLLLAAQGYVLEQTYRELYNLLVAEPRAVVSQRQICLHAHRIVEECAVIAYFGARVYVLGGAEEGFARVQFAAVSVGVMKNSPHIFTKILTGGKLVLRNRHHSSKWERSNPFLIFFLEFLFRRVAFSRILFRRVTSK